MGLVALEAPEAQEEVILHVVRMSHEFISRLLGAPQAISRVHRIRQPEVISSECFGLVQHLRWHRK